MRLVIGIKCRMKDWSKEIYSRNEGQGYTMKYFEWQSKELGFYPRDAEGLLMGEPGTVRRETGAEGTGAALSPPPGPIAIVQVRLLKPKDAEH